MTGETAMDRKLYLLAELDDTAQGQFKGIEKVIVHNGITGGSQTKNIPYHITLSEYPCDRESEVLEILDNVKNKFRKIDISYSSMGLFGLKVLFANPDMNAGLIKLYDFVKGQSLNKNNSLSAHTTLVIDDPENIMRILPEVSKAFNKISGKIDAVSLYEFFPERLIKRINLSI